MVVGRGGQTGRETRPIQLIKASAASLISSGRHLWGQERTVGRLKAERRRRRGPTEKDRESNATDRFPPSLCQPFICQMH